MGFYHDFSNKIDLMNENFESNFTFATQVSLVKLPIEFHGIVHHFRTLPKQTFENLLEDACRHFMVEKSEYELLDADGTSWPLSGNVRDVLTEELNSASSNDHSIGQNYNNTPQLPLIILSPLDQEMPISRQPQDFDIPVINTLPIIIESGSSTLDYSSVNDMILDYNYDSNPIRDTHHQSRSVPSNYKPWNGPKLASPKHHRTTSKSDTVRKMIEEDRLNHAIPPFMLETNQGNQPTNQSNHFGALSPLSPSLSVPSPAITSSNSNISNIPDQTKSSSLPIKIEESLNNLPCPTATVATHSFNSNTTVIDHQDLVNQPNLHPLTSPLMPPIPPMRRAYSESDNLVLASTPPLNTFMSSNPNLSYGVGSSTGSSASSSTASIDLTGLSSGQVPSSGTATHPTNLMSSNNSSSSSNLRISRFRLKKAYDNVTVNELLSDQQIKLGPTTHKDVSLEWEVPPATVLIIKKKGEPDCTELMREMACWLEMEKKLNVLIEANCKMEAPNLKIFDPDDPSVPYPDIIICLGGDGTVLHANTLFQGSMPPLMAFNLGSLGFLTPFRIRKYKQSISRVLQQCQLTLRSRLFVVVVKHVEGKEVVTKRTVLNEVVVDRGYSPWLSNLECFCDNVPITTIQADGIIVSSTTGSTAYSLSAGGSMVHPQIPAILFTPICPHSLSFRPLLFPDSVELKIQVPENSRSTAWASFDGRYQTELNKGDHLIIRISKWPFVWIRDSAGVGDWFKSLGDCLHWNDRRKQKPFSDYLASHNGNNNNNNNGASVGSSNDNIINNNNNTDKKPSVS